jgi:Cu+-exporting ATPase
MADPVDSSKLQHNPLQIVGGGVRAKDPVCGMTVDPLRAAGKQQHAGTTYYFCSARCAERFAREPEKFLAAPGSSGMDEIRASNPAREMRADAVKSAMYTCPMHPQIVQVGPGSCPICGMALEPVEVLAEAEFDPEYASMLRRFWVSATSHPVARRHAKFH